MPFKILVSIHKGGTGKTVTSMALAAALARAGKRVLLVDLDPQGHSTIGLGVELADNALSLRNVFLEPAEPIQNIIQETKVPGLKILPSTIQAARPALALSSRALRHTILSNALKPVLPHYDYIVMDCPPSLGPITEMGIHAADLVVIPTLMEARAADALVDLLDLLTLIKGEKFDDWGILVTKVDSRKSVTNEVVRQQLKPWAHKMFKTSIPQSEPLNQAQIARTDIFSYEPESKGAQAYRAFTEEILHYGR